jgi:TetR/AcrR family transcriptional regulator, cholesterol catabolism regulator
MTESTTVARAASEMPAWQRQRRQRIVRAALELLQHGEYDRIQVRDVAQRSGLALGTIYRYFNSKEHLYAAVLFEWANSLSGNLRRRPLRGEPTERLKQLIRRVVRAFERRPQFLRLEIVLENSSDEDALTVFHDVAERNYSSFSVALPNLPEEVANRIIFVVTSVLYRLLHQYALGRASIEDVVRTAEGTVDLIFSAPPAAVAPREAVAG